MHDVTLCHGDGCPLRDRCVRARAEPSARQDWFGRLPWDAARGRCDHFQDVAALAPSEAAIRERAYHLWLAAGRPEGQAEATWHRARAELEAASATRLRPASAR